MPDRSVSIVVVHYRTPHLLPECVRALRRSAEEAGLRGFQMVVVDNDPDRSANEVLPPAPDLDVVSSPSNLGYAAAFNLALDGPARGERIVLMNPDLLVGPETLGLLLRALEDGYGVAGPRLYWDRGQTLMLPPADRQGLVDEVIRALAARTPRLTAIARRRWRRHAVRHWCAQGTMATGALSGALMAFRREVLDSSGAGRFDSEYFLYYEETDWLQRARRAGVASALVTGAAAVHLYDQSGQREGRAAQWFAASRRRYLERRYGGFAFWIERLEAGGPPRAEEHPTSPPSDWVAQGSSKSGSLWLEISPTPLGFPAGGLRLDAGALASWQLPQDVAASHPGRCFWLRAVGAEGKESAPWLLRT